jgi:osmoprotectant transport system permease protein
MRNRHTILSWSAPVLLLLATVLLSTWEPFWRLFLGALFPQETVLLYPRAPLGRLVLEHLALVGLATGLAVVTGVPVGVWVTRRSGRDFHPVVDDLTSLAQTFPPVAVLALVIPVIGFGSEPTVVALYLFALLPIVRNTVSGIEGVAPEVKEAARGMGMSPIQILHRVEIPLAMRVIMAGVRIAVVINIGTATIGAVVDGGGLGRPIIAGLANGKTSFVLEGAAVAALLALGTDMLFSRVEALFFDLKSTERRPTSDDSAQTVAVAQS